MKTIKNITVLYNKTIDDNFLADVDTAQSAQEIGSVLANNYQINYLGISLSEISKIKSIQADLIFNCIEWAGENIDVAVEALKLLHDTGIPYTGSDAAGYELSSNKLKMKKKFIENNIPTPSYFIMHTGNERIPDNIKYPVLLKPLTQHCGCGITQDSLAYTQSELIGKAKKLIDEFKDSALVEEYIDGREIHVTVLEKYGQPWVLPPCEIIFTKDDGFIPILSYAAKWHEDSIVQ
jgi:D-alanine-D-alanine ligase